MLSLARSGLRIPPGGLHLQTIRRDLLLSSTLVRSSPRRLYSADNSPGAESTPADQPAPSSDAKELPDAPNPPPRTLKPRMPPTPKPRLAGKRKAKQGKDSSPAGASESKPEIDQESSPAPEVQDGDGAAPHTSTSSTRRHKVAQSKSRTNVFKSGQMSRMWRESLEILRDLRAAHLDIGKREGLLPKIWTEPSAAAENRPKQQDSVPSPTAGKGRAGELSPDAKKAADLLSQQISKAGASGLSNVGLSALPSAKTLNTVNPDDKERQVELLSSALKVLRKVLLDQSPEVVQHAAGTAPKKAEFVSHHKSAPSKAPAPERPEALGKVVQTKKASLASQLQKSAASQKGSSIKAAKEAPPKPLARPGRSKKSTETPAASEPEQQSEAEWEKGKTGNQSKKAKRREKDISIHRVDAAELVLTPIEKPQPPVPRIQYGLDRVLFNPGVYQLQDPRSRVYNFDPYLSTIMPTHEFDFNALKRYVTSSKDNTLISLAADVGKKYTGSTSSMTSTLSHFHYLLSSWRPINAAQTTREFSPESDQFTRIQRGPAAVFLHYKDGTYAIDADKEFDNATILSMLGKSMEKFLTLPRDEYELYHRDRSHELSEEARNDPEAFHYTTMGDFLMRSQLDAYDPRLPGTGMFDLKTRSVVSIRMQSTQVQKGMGYEIRDRFGQWESFEREYFDMIRSAFLKYSLQVRMGRMDGIFVAYHNIERIFGFQYISLAEMDNAIHGTDNTKLGDQEFKLSLHLLNKILDKATARFPKRSLRLHFETRPTEPPFMYVFAKPVTEEEIIEVQEKNKEAVEEFERRMMNLDPEGSSDEAAPAEEELEAMEEDGEKPSDELEIIDEDGGKPSEGPSLEDVWEDMMERVDQAMEDDALGIASVREAVEDALSQSGLLRSIPHDQSRTYIDALLGAITSPDLESAAEVIENDSSIEESSTEDEANNVEATAEDAPSPSAVDEYATADTAIEQLEVSESEADSVQTEDNHASEDAVSETRPESERAADEEGSIEGDAEDAAAEVSDVDSEIAETPAVKPRKEPELLSLKDLIIKLAEHSQSSSAMVSTEAKKPEEEPDRADSRRLKRFEKILSEMLSNSKQTGGDSTASAATAASDSSIPDGKTAESEDAPEEEEEIMAMAVTIRNSTGNGYVKRVIHVDEGSKWELMYSFEDIDEKRATALYAACKARREKLMMAVNGEIVGDKYTNGFLRKIDEYTMKGRKWRLEEDKRARELGKVKVYGMDEPLDYEEVFAHVSPTKMWETISAEAENELQDFPDFKDTQGREEAGNKGPKLSRVEKKKTTKKKTSEDKEI